MTRPAVIKSTVTDSILLQLPRNFRQELLKDVAQHLTNSDKAIQLAVALTGEIETGGATDLAIEQFERACGFITPSFIFMTKLEAQALINSLQAALVATEETK